MRIHVIDFEGDPASGVVEFGVVTLEQGSIVQTISQWCCPDAPMDPRSALVHGLRDSQLRGFPGFIDHRELFFELRSSGLFAAHHASVEHRFLTRYWHVVPVVGDGKGLLRQAGGWSPWIDTRLIAQSCLDSPDYGLMFLIESLGLRSKLEDWASAYCSEGRRKPHCALFDALGSAMLLSVLQERFRLSDDAMLRASQSKRAMEQGDIAQQTLL